MCFFKILFISTIFIKVGDVRYVQTKAKTGARDKKKIEVKATRVSILKSRNKTGFRGFIIDMESMMLLYKEFIEEKRILKTLPTYYFLQDVIELFFGRIRACGGFNNNPNVNQFKGAYRKLQSNIKIDTSKLSNCRAFDTSLPDNLNYSDIYFVSSKRAALKLDEDSYNRQKDKILEEVAVLDELESNNISFDGTVGTRNFSTAYIASCIEKKISECPTFHCNSCQLVFAANDKVDMEIFDMNVVSYKPCINTFEICKTAEKFFKLYDISKSKTPFDFKVLYCLIFRTLRFDILYTNSKFDCDISHKYQLIKCIVGQYVTRRANHVSRELTFDLYENGNTENIFYRQRLNRLVLAKGQ